MKIMIVGIGGVGGYVGGKLKLETDNKITFIARGAQLETIKKSGLKLIDENDESMIQPDTITDNPKNLGTYDLILLCTKSYDLQDALKLIKDNVSNDTVLLPLLNGVSHDKEIQKVFQNAKTLNGCIYILSNVKEPGVVKKYGGVFNLIFGTDKYPLEEFKNIKELFDEAGLRNKLTKDIELETWKKYLLISAYASMTSYYEKPLGFVANEKIDELKKVLYEIKSVANAKDIDIKDEVIEKILERIKTLPYESKTSMQLDYEKAKKTEVEALCGYVIKEADKFGLKVQYMRKYYDKLKMKNEK
jgi:2-dehydropantoate 2-reductase